MDTNIDKKKPHYVIVQAGGKGTRLNHLTANKPKALVPVKNLPILFYLFRNYPDSKFLIISDYKQNVLHNYLNSFATDIEWTIIPSEGSGNCAGIADAAKLIPANESALLIWSDLILPESGVLFPPNDNNIYIGISESLRCRWMFKDGIISETATDQYGIAGIFSINDCTLLRNVPDDGEFAYWLSLSHIPLKPWMVDGVREYGTLDAFNTLEEDRCRPFNRITANGSVITKQPLDALGRELAGKETLWYKEVGKHNFHAIPAVYSYEPLKMEKIQGKNIFEYHLSKNAKVDVLKCILQKLELLHSYESIPADRNSIIETYYYKTLSRLYPVRSLIPFSDKDIITVNGKPCRNVFSRLDELETRIKKLSCDRFPIIHGDCTFSNIMLRDDVPCSVVFIDPRGYYGDTLLYGDPRYDYAKLYYSIVGNYDNFNLRRFNLEIGGPNGSRNTKLPEASVELTIQSEGWEELEEIFFSLVPVDPDEIRLIHALIWLSLTSYAWHDYDSVCGAFYNGLYYLEDVI